MTKIKTTSDGNFKKPGTVGVVIESPSHNGETYLVQFSDEITAIVDFDEMNLRRREIDQMLVADSAGLSQYIIYRCQVGSKAFGLSNEDSDDDLRGIFLPPAKLHWSLYRLPEQIELQNDDDDEVYWEIEKFVRLALKANPNILETLWTPLIITMTPLAERLREIRAAFLSKHLYKTYSGYVLSQFRRMKNGFEKTGKYKVKHAMHLIRLLYSGIYALKSSEIMVDVTQHRDELMGIRSGEFPFETIRHRALELDKIFQAAFEKTELPEQPDFETVNRFLVDARREAV